MRTTQTRLAGWLFPPNGANGGSGFQWVRIRCGKQTRSSLLPGNAGNASITAAKVIGHGRRRQQVGLIPRRDLRFDTECLTTLSAAGLRSPLPSPCVLPSRDRQARRPPASSAASMSATGLDTTAARRYGPQPDRRALQHRLLLNDGWIVGLSVFSTQRPSFPDRPMAITHWSVQRQYTQHAGFGVALVTVINLHVGLHHFGLGNPTRPAIPSWSAWASHGVGRRCRLSGRPACGQSSSPPSADRGHFLSTLSPLCLARPTFIRQTTQGMTPR